MKIIIPMSGLGSRFIDAGFNVPKPLIKVHDKPIIEHVVNLFPGEEDFIFICREEHLKTTNLENVLKRIMPTGKIISIKGHKYGPVYAISKIFDLIKDNEPVITSYCDFYMHWDYKNFKETIKSNECDGAIPCYKGFHPHLLIEENLYAGCLTNNKNYLIDIKEKFSFTNDKTKSHHSAGIYYFKSGALIKKYFSQLMTEKINLNGEFYISLVYKLLIKDNLKTYIYDNITHFCQWGTPKDLKEYLYWSEIFNEK